MIRAVRAGATERTESRQGQRFAAVACQMDNGMGSQSNPNGCDLSKSSTGLPQRMGRDPRMNIKPAVPASHVEFWLQVNDGRFGGRAKTASERVSSRSSPD